MNKKGIIVIVIIIVLAVVGYMVWGGSGSTTTNEPAPVTTGTVSTETVDKDTYAPVTKETADVSLINRLKSASVAAAETGARVALVNGKATFSEGDVKGTITLGDVAIAKSVGSANYVLSTLSVSTGATGTFYYVVLFEDKAGTLVDKSYALIGDRVSVTGIHAEVVTDKQASVIAVSASYLDRDKGEPMTAKPSVSRTKILVVEGGEFNAAKEISL